MMSVNARTSVVCDARWDNGGTPVSLGAIADVYWGHVLTVTVKINLNNLVPIESLMAQNDPRLIFG